MTDCTAPIGVFDSGVGGLTVVRRLLELHPGEKIIYFGDTARVPYGTKSPETISRYAAEDTRFLLQFQPKMILVACNTVSALGMSAVLKEAGSIPVHGVIEPGANAAVLASKTGRIGVIGTEATIRSGAYEAAIHRLRPEAQVFQKACPLFVPLVEEGLFNHEATHLIAQDYLSPLLSHSIDTLVLGCTHYPLLKTVVEKIVGPSVHIIDSGYAVASIVQTSGDGKSNAPTEPSIYVSDLPDRFWKTAERFLGMHLQAPLLSRADGLDSQL